MIWFLTTFNYRALSDSIELSTTIRFIRRKLVVCGLSCYFDCGRWRQMFKLCFCNIPNSIPLAVTSVIICLNCNVLYISVLYIYSYCLLRDSNSLEKWKLPEFLPEFEVVCIPNMSGDRILSPEASLGDKLGTKMRKT